jgi:hypothetical protein
MAKTKLAFSEKPRKIFDFFSRYESLTIWSKKRSYLNNYILIDFNFFSLFTWILPLRLLAGRLTAHLKGGWPGARVGQNEEKFLVTYNVQTELIRMV